MSRTPLTLGSYPNFPQNIHWVETFISTISNRSLQEKIIRVFCETNQKEFSFEEVSNPTLPDCKIIFEIGLADGENFNYLDKEEEKKAVTLLMKERIQKIDFFCAIRYKKVHREKKTPLKFDYYLMRTLFSAEKLEIQLFHERGPRHIAPEDLTAFICNKINEKSTKKILKSIE